MASLDTNVLVRWLMADDAARTAEVESLFDAALAMGESLYVPSTVQLELEWVLRSRYGLDKDALLAGYVAMLETEELEMQHETALERALHLFRQTSVDFADCLHLGLSQAQGHTPMLTFDARAAKLDGARKVSA